MARTGSYPDDQDVKTSTKVAGRRGNIVWRPWRGKIVVQTTPRYTARASLDQIAPWTAWLRWMNLLWHYTDGVVRLSLLRLEQLSGVPARDWFTSFSRGHVFSYVMDDGTELFSVATRDRYSRSLDVFGQDRGSILYRETDAWDVVYPGEDGDTLTMSGGRPVWVSSGSAGGRGLWLGAEELRGYNTGSGYILTYIPAMGLSYSGTTGGTTVLLRQRYLGDWVPSVARLFVHAPSNAVGGVRFFLDVRVLPPVGEPVLLSRVGYTVDLPGVNRRWFWVSLEWPQYTGEVMGYAVLIGRDATHSEDTCGVALNLLGVEFA